MLLAGPDGRVERLAEHGVLMWPGPKRVPRTDQQRILPSGSTLLLYTDGLIENRGQNLDDAIDRAAAILSAGSAHQPLPDLVRQLTNEIANPAATDDLALLAVRIAAPPTPAEQKHVSDGAWCPWRGRHNRPAVCRRLFRHQRS